MVVMVMAAFRTPFKTIAHGDDSDCRCPRGLPVTDAAEPFMPAVINSANKPSGIGFQLRRAFGILLAAILGGEECAHKLSPDELC